MKENLEHNIRESLKNFEAPYDAKAWEATRKKLDQRLPVSKSNWKWYTGGAAVLAVLLGGIYLKNADSVQSKNNAQTATHSKVKVEETPTIVKNPRSESSEMTVEAAEQKNVNDSENSFSEMKSNNSNGASSSQKESNSASENTNNSQTSSSNSSPLFSAIFENNSTETKAVEEFKLPVIGNICVGEKISITNENAESIVLKIPNGEKITIKSKKSMEFTPALEGKHFLGYLTNSELILKESFTVMSAPKVDFTVDEQNKYENGIPSIDLKTTATGVSYSWNFEKQNGTLSGKEVSVHYFTKGNYTVSLTIQGSNGCKASESKNIQVDEDYNLLAVNAFDPASSDIRKNTFIPFALTQRSVDFRLIIIDPKDGGLIYETSDATKPWTGIDRRNGQMVETNKSFIWKVTLSNPLKGESPEYKGIIVRL